MSLRAPVIVILLLVGGSHPVCTLGRQYRITLYQYEAERTRRR